MGRLVSTIATVVVAVGLIGGLWVALNLLIDHAQVSWSRFSGIAAAVVAAVFFAILRGNRSLRALVAESDPISFGAGGGWLGHLEWSIAGALIWGVALFAMRSIPARVPRLAVGVGAGVLTGWLIGSHVQLWHRPELPIGTMIATTAIGAVLGAALRFRSGGIEAVRVDPGSVVPGALTGAAVGWVIGSWFLARFAGSTGEAIVAAAAPLALLGARLGWVENPSPRDLGRFDQRARAVVFLGPAVTFLSAALVIPALRTIYLSFLDRESESFVGFENYQTLLTQTNTFDLSKWSNIFTSQLFWVALFLIGLGVVIGFVSGTKRDGETSFARTGASTASLGGGLFIFTFAVFAVLRGTFFNNLWWVVTVTTLSTVLGLLLAVLTGRAGRLESVAKALIFMPMAVSFVGASIVWRLQYQPRDPTKAQTGVLNAVWVQLGRLSHSGWPRVVALLVLAAVMAWIVVRMVPRVRSGHAFALNMVAFVVVGHLFVELLRRSLGGFRFGPNGEIIPDTVIFLQEVRPFNNVFLMVILIWIQTGFAMVILSAAIKAVPEEFLEAARVDGATESQTFFNVVFPQILPTVGVVVTTLIVLVTKVFDIVKVTTGGNFGTNVLANDMFQVSFNFFNTGLGSAIAVFILISVLPVMYLNIRRMQKARVQA